MISRQTETRFSKVSESLIKDIMSDASKKFKRHFARVYNGFKGIEIPKSLVEEILSKPEFAHSILFEDIDEKFQFLTKELLTDNDFLYFYEDLHKANTLTGIIFVEVEAFLEVKNKLDI